MTEKRVSWNEKRDRAISYSARWKGVTSESGEAHTFWDEKFDIFGTDRKRVGVFEQFAKRVRADNTIERGSIDLFWPGVLLAEHKSKGESLEKAESQAFRYLLAIPKCDSPRYVILSDFARTRLYDLINHTETTFDLENLYRFIKHLDFLSDYPIAEIRSQVPVDIKATESVGKLHMLLEKNGYRGHELEMLLSRLLYCLFADNAGIFNPLQFTFLIEKYTTPDGSDLGPLLMQLFEVLNTPVNARQNNLDLKLAEFTYINGGLFVNEKLPIPAFNTATRNALLKCIDLDWSVIEPAIFGALFQNLMLKAERRHQGSHFTSTENILKIIKPLFLDALEEEFEQVRYNRDALAAFHKKLRSLTFMDPACGCGNFLAVAYRELRTLELKVLAQCWSDPAQEAGKRAGVLVNIDQFYGIEINETAAQIARLSLLLTDHQMNLRTSKQFGKYFARIPLRTAPHIYCNNALTVDWNAVVPASRISYIFGNPPFVGTKLMDKQQRVDTQAVFHNIENSALLDYVAAWYVKAADYLKLSPSIRCAFVSTNSLTQGEQAGILWPWLHTQGIQIHFAHQTFKWINEAKGVAGVHCVIIGFGTDNVPNKTIWEYDNARGEPRATHAKNINAYLANGPNVALVRRQKPLCPTAPRMVIGNKPIDDGNYLFTTGERDAFLKKEPKAARYFYRWLGSREFINGRERWCLWLGNISSKSLRGMPMVMALVEKVRRFRLASKSAPTIKLAETPTLFHVEHMPESSYLVMPKTSSGRRRYIPIGSEEPTTLCGDTVLITLNATKYDFAILTSIMHNAWMRYVGGRLRDDYRYSIKIVYNNFPWPVEVTMAIRMEIVRRAKAVLSVRAKLFKEDSGVSLADLYHPTSMPPVLIKAHQELDRAVDAAYGRKGFKSESERLTFLLELYLDMTKPA